MSVFTTLMILILVGSLAVCLLGIWRLFAYNSKYHLPEVRYTRLFQILTKEHFATLYVLVILLHMLITVWFILTL